MICSREGLSPFWLRAKKYESVYLHFFISSLIKPNKRKASMEFERKKSNNVDLENSTRGLEIYYSWLSPGRLHVGRDTRKRC